MSMSKVGADLHNVGRIASGGVLAVLLTEAVRLVVGASKTGCGIVLV